MGKIFFWHNSFWQKKLEKHKNAFIFEAKLVQILTEINRLKIFLTG